MVAVIKRRHKIPPLRKIQVFKIGPIRVGGQIVGNPLPGPISETRPQSQITLVRLVGKQNQRMKIEHYPERMGPVAQFNIIIRAKRLSCHIALLPTVIIGPLVGEIMKIGIGGRHRKSRRNTILHTGGKNHSIAKIPVGRRAYSVIGGEFLGVKGCKRNTKQKQGYN